MMLKTKPTVGHRVARFAALAQAALLLFWGAVASAQDGNRLQDIQVQSLPGDRVELKLIMSETAPEPLDFTIENPARIALDLPNTALGMSQRRRDVNLGLLDTVLTAEANGRTRVVLNLESMVEYTTQVSGNTVTVTLGDADSYSAGSTQFASAPSSDRSYAAPGNRAISSVDFRRTRDGGGRVIVSLTDPGGYLDFTLRSAGAARPLTGGDLDPESFVRLADGSCWIGEEFGPFLLHVDADDERKHWVLTGNNPGKRRLSASLISLMNMSVSAV